MSPELLCPEDFGLADSRRTEHSDCYALGMVIYEVLSGQVPFSRYETYAAIVKIGRGERPERPQGAEGKWFTDVVWSILKCCWASKRDDRPSIEDVLQVLEEASRSWTPLSPLAEGPPATDSPTWSLSDSITEESSGKGEVLSFAHAAPSQPPQTLLPKGDASDNSTYLSSAGFPAPLHEALDHQDLGAYVGLSDVGSTQPPTVFPVIPQVGLLRIYFDKFFISRTLQSPQSLSPVPNLIQVPLRAYKRRNKQWDFKRLEPISFNVNVIPGIRLSDAFSPDFMGLDCRDDLMFQDAGKAISCRLVVRLLSRFPPRIRADVVPVSPGTHLTPCIR